MSAPTQARPTTRREFLRHLGSGALACALSPLPSAAAERSVVSVYNWNDYIGNTTLDTFTERTGVTVRYDLYENLEQMLTRLVAGNPGYDVIFPSDYAVEAMIKLKLLQRLDHTQIPNIEHIDAGFLNPSFDPGCRHNVPHFWGTIGIGYRKSKVSRPPTWKDLLDSAEHSGRIALLSDSRLVLALTLIYLGYSPNSTSPPEIAQARDLLLAQKRHLKAFTPHAGQDLLLNGEVDLVMEWNGDLQAAMQSDDDIGFEVPVNGGILWIDGICIPKGAPNIDNAYRFINHLHDPQVNAEMADTVRFATSNKTARMLISERDRHNPAIYLPESVLSRCRSLIDIGQAKQFYDEAWDAIQAA